MASIIEDHPQRKDIESWILTGESTRKIAAKCNPPVSHVAIANFRSMALKPILPMVANSLKNKALAQAKNAGQDLTKEQVTQAYNRESASW